MGELHITKVAFGCKDIETLERYVAARMKSEGCAYIFTRFLPKRAEELEGGSLYWIVRSHLACRQRIIGFAEAVDAQGRKRIRIGLEPEVIRTVPRHFRPHQGWRYLEGADAPPDLSEGRGEAELPPEMLNELARLGLV